MYSRPKEFARVLGSEELALVAADGGWQLRRGAGEPLATFASDRLPLVLLRLQQAIRTQDYSLAYGAVVGRLPEEMWWLRAKGCEIRTTDGAPVGVARSPELARVIARVPDTLSDLELRHMDARCRRARSAGEGR